MEINWEAISKNASAAYVIFIEQMKNYDFDMQRKAQVWLTNQDLGIKVLNINPGEYQYNIKGVLPSGSRIDLAGKSFQTRDEAYAEGVMRAFMIVNTRYAPKEGNWLDLVTPQAVQRQKKKEYFKKQKR